MNLFIVLGAVVVAVIVFFYIKKKKSAEDTTYGIEEENGHGKGKKKGHNK